MMFESKMTTQKDHKAHEMPAHYLRKSVQTIKAAQVPEKLEITLIGAAIQSYIRQIEERIFKRKDAHVSPEPVTLTRKKRRVHFSPKNNNVQLFHYDSPPKAISPRTQTRP